MIKPALALAAAFAVASCQTDSGGAASSEAAQASAASSATEPVGAADDESAAARERPPTLPRPQVSNMPTPAPTPDEIRKK